jgi:regulator of sigma E protease
MSVVSLLFLIMWLVGIYNFGYVLAAKILGYPVNEFSIGYGPKLAGFTLGRTRFSLRLILIGGYVNIGRLEASLSSLFLTCCGPLAVILVSFFVMGLHLYRGYDVIAPGGALIVEGPANETGLSLKKGDVVRRAGGQEIGQALDLVQQLDNWKSGELTLEVSRDARTYQVTLKRNLVADGSRLERLGIVFSSLTEKKRLGFFEAQFNSPYFLFRQVAGYVVVFWVQWGLPGSKNVSLLDTVYSSMSLQDILFVCGILAFSLGVLNLLPLPILVGGQALNIGIEMLLRRPLDSGFKERLQQIGFVILILLMAFVIIHDIYSLSSERNKSYEPRSRTAVSVMSWSQANVRWQA